jgi:Sigma-70 region 2
MAERRHVSVDGTSPSQDELDSEFVKRCVSGDTSAFAPLVERYQRVLFTVALRMLGDPDEAADAAQDAFVKAYQQLRTFDPSRRFSAGSTGFWSMTASTCFAPDGRMSLSSKSSGLAAVLPMFSKRTSAGNE